MSESANNPLRFHWMLPKGGELTNQETARVLTTNEVSYAGVPDMDNWVDFAQQAEKAGIESVLLSFGNYEPDTILVACALGRETEKLKFIVAYRMGLMKPSLFVQQVNTLSNMIQGRFSLNVIAGSSPAEQRGYGDFLNHDERYARAEEFLSICHGYWRKDPSVDFEGKYCRVEGGKLHTPFRSPNREIPEIHVSGHSTGAEQLARNQGSSWLRLIDTPENLAPMVERNRAFGIEVSLRLSVICRPTKEEALAAAQALKEDRSAVDQVRKFVKSSDSRFLKDALAMADDNEWRNDHLWAGLVPGFGPSTISLVGTPQDLAEAFMEYKRIGINQFIISGWPKLDEMIIFGKDVIPLVRQLEMSEKSRTTHGSGG